MASDSGQDHQVMRQRDAGTRKIESVNYAPDINAMPRNSREERQLMRQRGAGTRKINNVDFGIAFPTPTRARRSATKTPQAAPQSSRRPSQTPSWTTRSPSGPRTLRGSSASQRRNTAKRQSLYDVPADERDDADSSTAKRRKLNNPTNDARTPSAGASASIAGAEGQVSASRRRTVSKPVVIAEEPENLNLEQAEQRPNLGGTQEHEMDKENVIPWNFISGDEKPTQKRKKRKSIGQHSTRQRKRSSGNSFSKSARAASGGPNRESIGPDENQYYKVGDKAAEVEGQSAKFDNGGLGVDNSGEDGPEAEPDSLQSPDAGAEPALEVKKKRKKRKSVVLVRKKRRSSGESSRKVDEPSQLMTPDDSAEGQEFELYPSVEDEAEAELSNDEVRSAVRKRRSIIHRHSSPLSEFRQPSIVQRPIEADEIEDETYIDDEYSEPPTPAILKKQRKRRSNNGVLVLINSGDGSVRSRSKKVGPPKPKKTRATFPILTHRLTNVGALPTIAEEQEDQADSEDDLNSTNVRFRDRVAPNAVDVLAQICRETIETTISRIVTGQAPAAGRMDVKHKRAALEAFGKHLDTRLFDMSAAVENRLTLEARVKRSKRQKADLQARWIEVRRQREGIALKCDTVRRKHWGVEADGKERHELSEQLHRVEMVMERGVDDAEDGLEFMLRSVGCRVSGADGRGLLDRVKEFNRQLERTAAVLEGRL